MNDHIKSEISTYLAGALPESRNRQIEAHAAACEKCRNALAKARAKQARVKREALKKASTDPMPNLFLARQGKEFGADTSKARNPWAIPVLVVLIGVGYWGYSRYGRHLRTEPPALPESAANPVPVTAVPEKKPTPLPVSVEKPPVTPKPPIVLTVQQEWKGSDCGIKESRLVVIRNKEAWQKLWAEAQLTDPLPEIEFGQRLVVGIFGGVQPVGTTISLGTIEEADDGVYAPYRISVPAAPAAPVGLSHPYLLAAVQRVDKKIRLSLKEN